MIPLLVTLVPPDTIALQLVKLGYLRDLTAAGGPGSWDPATHHLEVMRTPYTGPTSADRSGVRSAGGLITLVKTIPTIISSFREEHHFTERERGGRNTADGRDLSFKVVIAGSHHPGSAHDDPAGDSGRQSDSELLIGVLIIIFGFFFVTVASRIVGLVGIRATAQFQE